MKKLCSEAQQFLERMHKERGSKYQNGGMTQRGLGFESYDPFQDTSRYGDVLKAGAAGFLGNRISSQAYFDYLNPDDPEKAKRLSMRSATITGGLNALGAGISMYGEARDYRDNAERIARQKANDYYRTPRDPYAYNEFLDNQYNNVAYKQGGMVGRRAVTKRRYQDGGEIEEEVVFEDAPQEQVVFDSASYAEQSSPSDMNMDYGPEDNLPMNSEGYDLASFRPTLGNVPISQVYGSEDVMGTMNSIATKESGGRYDVVNTSGGKHAINATGKYQFVPKYWHDKIAKFQGTEGQSMEDTMEKFRQSPQTQDAFMAHVTKNIYMPEVQKLMPLARQYGLTQDAVIKMLHYRGIDDTTKRLKSGDFQTPASEKARYNNPDIMSYITR